MKFVVTRTSQRNDEKPCEEAYQGTLVRVDMRNVRSPEQLTFKCDRETWYEKGTNHRLIDGCIARDFDTEIAWFVDINTIDELIAFNKKYGELVITTSFIDHESCEIEIYDYYRE